MSKVDLFLKYLQDIGLTTDDNTDDLLTTIQTEAENKTIIFALAHFLQNLSASDLYDLSSRVFNQWFQYNYLSISSSPISQTKKFSAAEMIGSNQFELQIHRKNNLQELESTNTDTHNLQEKPKNLQERTRSLQIDDHSKVSEFNHIDYNRGKQSPDLQDEGACTEPFEEETNINNSKNADGTKQTSQINPTSEARFNKLYNARITQEHNRLIKSEIAQMNKLKECTFSPKINKYHSSPKASMENLPAYQRLSKIKTPSKDLQKLSRENKELEGATFQPDLSLTNRGKISTPRCESPEYQSAIVSERLYKDFQSKQHTLLLQKESLKAQELAECTFKPQLFSSPVSQRTLNRKNSDAADRLYQDSVRRSLDKIKAEKIKENERSECTFHPQKFTADYENKNKNRVMKNDGILTRIPDLLKEVDEQDRESAAQTTRCSKNPGGQSPRSQLGKVLKGRSQSTLLHDDPLQEITRPLIQKESNLEAFNRLYEEGKKRKHKISALEAKVNQERGVTFKPMTSKSQASFSLSNTKSPKSVTSNKENTRMLSPRTIQFNPNGDGLPKQNYQFDESPSESRAIYH